MVGQKSTPIYKQAQVDFAQFKTDFTEEPGRVRVVWLYSLVLGYSRFLTGQFVYGQHLATRVRDRHGIPQGRDSAPKPDTLYDAAV